MKKLSFIALFSMLSVFAFTSCKPNDTPAPIPEPTYDYKLDAKYAIGDYNCAEYMEGFASYFLLLSEMKATHALEFEKEGLVLTLDLYGEPNEAMLPPTGKFKFITGMELPEGPSVSDYSNAMTIGTTLEADEFIAFEKITLEISRTGDVYTIIFDGVTAEDKKSYHCSFQGTIAMRNITETPTAVSHLMTLKERTSSYTLRPVR